MDALRRLSWPNFIPINRRQTSQSLHSIPNTPISKSLSVQDLIIQIESKQEHPRRRSEEEARPHRITCCSLIRHPASNHSRTTSPSLEAKQVDQMAPSKMAIFEGETILGPHTRLPNLPEGLSGDIGGNVAEFSLRSRLAREVDSTADGSEELPPILDTPTGYARFGFISRESFNTAVQDLVQENPDTPIGGDGAAPMKRSPNIGTLAMNGSRAYLDAPKIEISSPTNMLEYKDEKMALRSQPNFSDPFQDQCKSTVRPQTSASSPMMLSAPQSPRACRANNQTSLSLDGPGGGGTDVRDFAQQPNFPPPPNCCISPRSLISDNYVFASPTIDTTTSKENLPGLLVSVVEPLPIMIEDLGTANRKVPKPTGISAGPVPDKATSTGAPGIEDASVIMEEVSLRGLNTIALPHVPVVIEEMNIKRPNGPNPQVPTVGIPRDATGQLHPPCTPPRRARKRRTLIGTGQRVYRKGRRVMLTKPVLAVLVGRQLSGPAAEALKLISKGTPLDLSDLPNSAPPVPAPRIPT
jgi:hypothetical protein